MAQPLSPDKDLVNDELFRSAGKETAYRVRVSRTSLERGVVSEGLYGHKGTSIVICQCDGTAKAVDACLMGMFARREHASAVGVRIHPIMAAASSACDEARTYCNQQANEALRDYRG